MMRKFSANVTLWLNCNLRCPYCFSRPVPPPKTWVQRTADQLSGLERFFNRTGLWQLIFSGGEPTIYPGFSSFCSSLVRSGHQVSFISNGTIPFPEVFTRDGIKDISQVTLSYHTLHEQNPDLRKRLDDNVAFLVRNGVVVTVNYVLYPRRKESPATIRKQFEQLGAQFKFLAFQGEFEGRRYPYAYTAEDQRMIAQVGDIRARFMIEHGEYMPTFKACRAGSGFFAISLHTGGVYACEQLQQNEIVNLHDSTADEKFLARVRNQPMVCMAKRCFCRFTLEQESFLDNHDVWDMENYPEWERLSLPSPRAKAHWEAQEKRFVDELTPRFTGKFIYLWGGGLHSQALLALLDKWGFPLQNVVGIIDSSPLRQGQSILGIPIVVKDCLDAATVQCSDILISSRTFEEEIHGEIRETFGDRFHVIRLYDGSMQARFEELD